MTVRLTFFGAGGTALLLVGTLAAARSPDSQAQRGLPVVAPTPRLAGTGLTDTVPLYTEEQLAAGKTVYDGVCAVCHEDKDYTNPQFRSKWNGRSLYDLFTEVRAKMPEDNPGSLTPEEYAGALAYVLKLNGVPAGQVRVMPDSAAMSAAMIALPAAPAR